MTAIERRNKWVLGFGSNEEGISKTFVNPF
jgi:hypothetical protein